MGSSYELALQLFCDMVSLMLQHKLSIDSGQMKGRHTNLE
jgi:hypothetical protein